MDRARKQIETILGEGIGYFRSALRACSPLILQELKPLQAGEEESRQIAALLSAGTIPALGERCIQVLNRIAEIHAAEFREALTRPKETPSG